MPKSKNARAARGILGQDLCKILYSRRLAVLFVWRPPFRLFDLQINAALFLDADNAKHERWLSR